MLKQKIARKAANWLGLATIVLGIGLSSAKPMMEVINLATPQQTVYAKPAGKAGKEKERKTLEKKDKKKDDPGGGSDDSSGGGSSSGQGDSYSFYHLASSAATYFDGSQNPDLNDSVKYMDGKAMADVTNLGDAGGLVGYEDSQYDKKNWIGSVTSALSSSAQGHSYNAYTATDTRDVYYYGLYGHALASMGLDSTAPQEGITSIFRWLFGIIMMIAYAGAVTVPIIFYGIGKFLQLFNPFQWFLPYIGSSMSANFSDPLARAGSSANTVASSIPGLSSIWDGMAKTVGGLYAATQKFGMYITVPACIIIGITMLVLGRATHGRGMSMLKKGLLRAVIIVFGVPIFADFYTSAVNQMTISARNNPAANIVLASTFNDFENWAANTRLALPEGTSITLDNLSSHPSGDLVNNSKDKTTDVRELARKINNIAGTGLLADGKDSSSTDANDIWKDASTPDSASLVAGFDLLGRYINGSKYSAAQYETMYKSHLDTTATKSKTSGKSKGESDPDSSEKGQILKGIKYLAADPGVFSNDKVSYFTHGQNPKGGKNGRADFLWNAKQGINVNTAGKDNGKNVTDKDVTTNAVTFVGNGGVHKDGKGGYNYGLSSLSLYNYLTTQFTDSSIIVYSPNKISSMFVAQQHHSVDLVGTGINQVGYYLNAFALFIAIAIVGWGYAIATLTGVLYAEIRSLMHIPVMAIGSLNSAARFFAAVMVMIVQIMSTIFLYSVAMDFLIGINLGTSSVFDGTVNNFSKPGSGVIMFSPGVLINGATNVMGTVIYLILSTILTIGIAFVALKARKSFVKAINEWIGDLIDKLLMTGSYGSSAGNNYMTHNGGASQTISNENNAMDNVSQGFHDGVSTGGNTTNNETDEGDENNSANSGSPDGAKDTKNPDDSDRPGGVPGADKQTVPPAAENSDAKGDFKQASDDNNGSADNIPNGGVSEDAVNSPSNQNAEQTAENNNHNQTNDNSNNQTAQNSNANNHNQSSANKPSDLKNVSANRDQHTMSPKNSDKLENTANNTSSANMDQDKRNPSENMDQTASQGENRNNDISHDAPSESAVNSGNETRDPVANADQQQILGAASDVLRDSGQNRDNNYTSQNSQTEMPDNSHTEDHNIDNSQDNDTANANEKNQMTNELHNPQTSQDGQINHNLTAGNERQGDNLTNNNQAGDQTTSQNADNSNMHNIDATQDQSNNPQIDQSHADQSTRDTAVSQDSQQMQSSENSNSQLTNPETNQDNVQTQETAQNMTNSPENNQINSQTSAQNTQHSPETNTNNLQSHVISQTAENNLQPNNNQTMQPQTSTNNLQSHVASQTAENNLQPNNNQTMQPHTSQNSQNQTTNSQRVAGQSKINGINPSVSQNQPQNKSVNSQTAQNGNQKQINQSNINRGLNSQSPAVKQTAQNMSRQQSGQKVQSGQTAILPQSSVKNVNGKTKQPQTARNVTPDLVKAKQSSLPPVNHKQATINFAKGIAKTAVGAGKMVYSAGVLASTGNVKMAGQTLKQGAKTFSGGIKTAGRGVMQTQHGQNAYRDAKHVQHAVQHDKQAVIHKAKDSISSVSATAKNKINNFKTANSFTPARGTDELARSAQQNMNDSSKINFDQK